MDYYPSYVYKENLMRYEDYMMSSPMTDGKEMASFFDLLNAEMEIKTKTRTQCENWVADVRGSFGVSTKETVGIVSVHDIARKIRLDDELTEAWLVKCLSYNLVQKHGSNWMV